MRNQKNKLASGIESPNFMDRLARTRIGYRSVSLPAFQVCGYTGLVFAIVLGLFVVGETGLSLWVIGAISVAAMATFLVLAFATKVITGEDQLIYYHHEIAIMLVSASVSTLLHRSPLPYLDVTILGVGTFLAFGRIGCLMVGCCHGRPYSWGICYRRDHANEGFAPYLVGVRLFPIQAVESLFVFLFVVAGAMAILQGRPAGTAFALYTIGYGFVRFCLEFFRGDADRPYTFGFSQGQWLSLWLMSGLAWAELSGRIAFHAWHLAVVLALPVIMLLVAVWRKIDPAQKFRFLHPYHVNEIASALEQLGELDRQDEAQRGAADAAARVAVACTSLGLRISAGASKGQSSAVTHFTISCRGRRMTQKSAVILADLILKLKPASAGRELLAGEQGVFHLVMIGLG